MHAPQLVESLVVFCRIVQVPSPRAPNCMKFSHPHRIGRPAQYHDTIFIYCRRCNIYLAIRDDHRWLYCHRRYIRVRFLDLRARRVAHHMLVVCHRGSSGVFAGLMASPAVRMGSIHDVGSRLGISMTIIALGAVAGPPISGAINAATGTFKFTGIYAGVSQHGAPRLDCVDNLL